MAGIFPAIEVVGSNKMKRFYDLSALIIVSATPGHFFQPGKNSLSLKQLAGFPKTPWSDLSIIRAGQTDAEGRFA
jgi:hypothetical protein